MPGLARTIWGRNGGRLGAALAIGSIGLLSISVLSGGNAQGIPAQTADLPGTPPQPVMASQPPPANGRETEGSFLHYFSTPHDSKVWYKADFSYPGPHPAWQAKLIHFEEDRVDLELRRKRFGSKKYAGAEYQRFGFYHYGRYEVVMRAAPGSGTVSAMFTHTHDQFGDPHDEIDIEFLGKNLRTLHANYFTGGKSYGSHYIPLGFDASKEVHLYAFEWEPGEIRWYVDGKLKHRAREKDHPIPQAPGRLMIQLWTGSKSQENWHGKPTFEDGTRASYYCLSYLKAGDIAPQCSDNFDAKAANAAITSRK